MSATPVYDYKRIWRLHESGLSNADIADRVGADPHYIGAILIKLRRDGIREIPDAVGEATETDFADEARTAARLRKSCEAATAALIAAYPERVVRT